MDIVQIITTKNIKFMSGPKGYPANPNGNWSIVGNLPGGLLMVAKEETIVVVPVTDVRKIGAYDMNKALKIIKNAKTKQDVEFYKGEISGEAEEAPEAPES